VNESEERYVERRTVVMNVIDINIIAYCVVKSFHSHFYNVLFMYRPMSITDVIVVIFRKQYTTRRLQQESRPYNVVYDTLYIFQHNVNAVFSGRVAVDYMQLSPKLFNDVN